MRKNLFVVALALFAFVAFDARRTNAQVCNNFETFGVRQARPVDQTLQSQIEVTYFTTNDPNVFVSERAGRGRSASLARMSADQFVATVERLEREGAASVKKRQTATSFLGEMAGLNLERESADARTINANFDSTNYVFGLNRESEISVFRGSQLDGDYFRVSLLSWFVNVTSGGARKSVDYDANILLKPGQTAVFKLLGDEEVRRSGAARSYIAVTLRSVKATNAVSTARARIVGAAK